MLIINLSFLAGLITNQEKLKGLATDGCTRYNLVVHSYVADKWRCRQSGMHAHDEGTYTYIMHNGSFCNVKYTSNNK